MARNDEWCKQADTCTACNGAQRVECKREHDIKEQARLTDEEIKDKYYYTKIYACWDLDEALKKVSGAQLDKAIPIIRADEREKTLKALYNWLVDNHYLCGHCGTIVLEKAYLEALLQGRLP